VRLHETVNQSQGKANPNNVERFLTPEDETATLSRNFSKELQLLAVR